MKRCTTVAASFVRTITVLHFNEPLVQKPPECFSHPEDPYHSVQELQSSQEMLQNRFLMISHGHMEEIPADLSV